MLIDLVEAGAIDAGGKARGLARLVAAGLPVPPGFALTGAAFAATVGALVARPPLAEVGAALAALATAAVTAVPTAALAAEVSARARALGPRLAVRSSLAIEDGVTHAAPGLGTTVLGVAPDEVWPAIRAVWSAAMTPTVVAYVDALGDRGPPVAAPGVIVQAHVAGYRATVYTRAPGRPADDEVWVAAGAGPPDRLPRAPTRWREAVELALAAEAAIGATAGADVELVWSLATRGWVIVQARPLIHPPARRPRRPIPSALLAPLREPPRAWRRDVTHNPAPLSVAQAELCARVEAAAIAPFHLAVVASHLYWAPRADAPPPPTITSARDLRDRVAAAEAAVAAILDDRAPAPTLDAAVGRYLDAYRILATDLAPLIAVGRAILPAALAARGRPAALAATLTPRRPSSVAARLAAAARGELSRADLLAAIGDVAPAWDVMAPTFAEVPHLLDGAIARTRGGPPPLEPVPPPELAVEVAIARVAVDAAERDDLWYWRAQALVRRALLAAAARTGKDASDVFWIPLADAAASLAPEVVRGRAAAARSAARRAAAWELPLRLDDHAARPEATRWQGAGVGAVVSGPIHHVDGWSPVPRGAVALARAVTPALAVALVGAVAIVSEHGTPLDHGAAMARELGLPCVVGCPGICEALTDGAWVTVDGDRGLVIAAELGRSAR